MRSDGNVPPWVVNRLDKAIDIHNRFKDNNSESNSKSYIITLSGGTIHKPPPLDSDGYPIFESVAAARFLEEKGVNPERILSEIASYDTIGNAYFSRMIHTEPRKFRRLLIITSQFHMERTRAIFEWVYRLPLDHSTDRENESPYELFFAAVPDVDEGIDDETRRIRTEKEKKGLERILKFKNEITTLMDFHRWMYTKHGAYAVATPPVRLTGKILNSY
jgi:hypothetical protein